MPGSPALILAYNQFVSIYQQLTDQQQQSIIDICKDAVKQIIIGESTDGERKKAYKEYKSTIKLIKLKKDFEDFLNQSYREIDYQSGWSIFPKIMDKVRDSYWKELSQRGLLVTTE